MLLHVVVAILKLLKMSELMLRFLRLSLGQLHPFVVVCKYFQTAAWLRLYHYYNSYIRQQGW